MKKFILALAALSVSPLVAANSDTGALLKRTDVKSYEGFIQVSPKRSALLDMDILFIRPAFDYRPISSGAMVGLIQNIGRINGLKIKFGNKCVGDINIKIGVKEFNGSQYGHVSTSWNINRYSDTISLTSAVIKDKETESSEQISKKSIRIPTSKKDPIYIDLPYPINYFPGDVLVLEEMSYTTNEDRIFSQCSVHIEGT